MMDQMRKLTVEFEIPGEKVPQDFVAQLTHSLSELGFTPKGFKTHCRNQEELFIRCAATVDPLGTNQPRGVIMEELPSKGEAEATIRQMQNGDGLTPIESSLLALIVDLQAQVRLAMAKHS